mmetsp:Transcript_10803/g.25267  ORF Transcript_10803/g.25267 Transcript_10803/m.25267 type:complete len:365 (-) Transcript_10803:114-1208(-)
MAVLDEADELPLRQDRVLQVQPRKLDLPRPHNLLGGLALVGARRVPLPEPVQEARRRHRADGPVVQRTVVGELEGAQGVGDPLEGVRERVGEVVHGVDAPFVPEDGVRGAPHPVQGGVAKVHVRARHVDLGPQHRRLPVLEAARPHLLEQLQVLRRGARVPVRRVPPGLGQGAPVLAHLLRRQKVHVGQPLIHEVARGVVEHVEVVGGVPHWAGPRVAARRFRRVASTRSREPTDVLHDAVHVLDVLLHRIGVIEAHVGAPLVFFGKAEVEADRLGVPDVEVPVRLRGEPGDQRRVLPRGQVVFNDGPNEVLAPELQRRLFVCRARLKGRGFFSFRDARTSPGSGHGRPPCEPRYRGEQQAAQQ